MNTVLITTDFITLGQFLKYIGAISNGSEAKNYLVSNKIYVNNEFETRRGRKIYPGFTVKIGNKSYFIVKNDN